MEIGMLIGAVLVTAAVVFVVYRKVSRKKGETGLGGIGSDRNRRKH